MTILVTGATGAVGRHLVDGLIARGASVRALSRKPEEAKLPSGVDVVAGDLNDSSSLSNRLFHDVEQVFVFPAEKGVDTFVERAAAAGASRFVVLSSLAAAAEHPRDIGSASYVHHLAIEEAVAKHASDWTFLRPGTFANNLLSWVPAIRSGQPIRAPYLDSAQAPIHEADVADAGVVTLLEQGHSGKSYPLTGPQALTRREQVDAIAAAIGHPLALEEITPEQFRQEFGQWIPADITDMLLDYWRDTVNEPDQVRSVQPLTGQAGRTLATWATDHRSAFVDQ
jgi:uncharacterized protein YbjT (DUF2867 family)